MYTMCITEKTAQQQHIFEQTFLQMLLDTHYDEITISDLCRKAGLSRKIFYRLFEKKADVLYSLIDHTLMEAQSYVPDDSVAPGELHRFLAYWKNQKPLLDALGTHQNSALLTDRAIRHVLSENIEVIHTFGADVGEYGFETILFYITGIFTLVLAWHQQGYKRSIDEMADLLMKILTTTPVKNDIVMP